MFSFLTEGLSHPRVSVGTQAEMDEFLAAFKEVMAAPAKATAGVQRSGFRRC